MAGLLVTRGAERDREFAVRTALGGSRIQLLRQLLVEGLLLSAGGAVVGLLLATRTFDVLETLVPDSLRGAVAPTLDLRLLTVALVAVLLTGLIFGLVPLRHALRMDLRTPLNTRTTSPATGRRRAQAALVAAEVALAVVVLFSTGLMIRTILNLQAVDPGFRVDNVLTAKVADDRGGVSDTRASDCVSTARCSTVWVAFPASCRRASRRSCHTPCSSGPDRSGSRVAPVRATVPTLPSFGT